MRQLLFAFIFLFSISIISCSDSGTGPDPDNEETTSYSVAVDVSPSDAGSISPSAEDSYEEGEEIELQADANDEYLFTHWSGDIDSTSDNPLSLTVDQNYNLTANFELKTYELSINTVGEGSVSEEVLKQKSKDYEHGTVVELTANPSEGYKFVEWEGDVTGSENPAQITVDDPKEVTAVFEKKSYELTVNTEGKGAVSEEIVQQKTTDYEYGTVVELTANPAEDWEFVEWTGATSGSDNPTQITVDESKEVTAVFEKNIFTLTIKTTGEGSVSLSPDQQEYEKGTSVELTANTTGDWEFDQWQGDLTGSNSPENITIDSDKSITALFKNTLFAGGVGTESSPYQISTVEQLQAINQYPSANYLLINDIDASGTVNWNNGKGFEPIGNESDFSFSGTLYGNGNAINSLFIDRPNTSSVGLIGKAEGAHVENIRLKNIDITGNSVVGGLIGRNRNGYVSNCSVTGQVKAEGNLGGLIGYNYGPVSKSHSNVTISGNGQVGGLIARNSEGEIRNSYALGEVNGGSGETIGGLIGINFGLIKNSYATGNVSGGSRVGGLVGDNVRASIIQSFAKGDVTGETTSGYVGVGGLVGYKRGGKNIKNSYAIGDVTGYNSVGGLVGTVDASLGNSGYNGQIDSSYAAGSVSGNQNVGGLVGWNYYDSFNHSYWDIESTGQNKAVGDSDSEVNGVTGLSTTEMIGNTAKDNMAGFNWGEIWVTTNNYPALFWE